MKQPFKDGVNILVLSAFLKPSSQQHLFHLKNAGILTLLTLLPKETWRAGAFEVVYHLDWVTGPSVLARIELARGLVRNNNLT